MRPPSRRSALGLWLPVVGLVGLCAVQPSASAQTGRSQERDLYVSVLDPAGKPVTGLDAREFVVREDGTVREVLRLRRATDPIDLAILVDNSQVSAPAMLDLRRGLESFVARMRDHGHQAIVTVADRPTIAQDYTSDGTALQNAVGRLFAVPGSGATFLEGFSEVLAGLKKRDAPRAAMLAIWLGGREFSGLARLDVIRELRDAEAALHVVTVGSGVPPDVSTEEGREREIAFDRGSRESGGRRVNVLSSMGLRDALDALAEELTSQYRLTYARPDSLIPPSQVEVRVRTGSLTVRSTPVRSPRKGASTP